MNPKMTPKSVQNELPGGSPGAPGTDSGSARVLRDFGVNLNNRSGTQNGAKINKNNDKKSIENQHPKKNENERQKGPKASIKRW